jgi:hypothetical protein
VKYEEQEEWHGYGDSRWPVKVRVSVPENEWESDHWELIATDHGPRIFPPVRCSECEETINDLLKDCAARSAKAYSSDR